MPQAMSATVALQHRGKVISIGDGEERWKTMFMGLSGSKEVVDAPQAFFIEMVPNDVIKPHFHAVDQFQVFVSGGGKLGRDDEHPPVTIHYADRFTGYGPITAGPQGYSYFTLRALTDTGAVYMHHAGYREKLRPSRKRHGTAQVALSTELVLFRRNDAVVEQIMGAKGEYDDGLSAYVVRLGPQASVLGPDGTDGGGQYCLVVNGTLQHEGKEYSRLSLLWVGADEGPLQFTAGGEGCEIVVMQFGRKVVSEQSLS